jgi:hypothetical protein
MTTREQGRRLVDVSRIDDTELAEVLVFVLNRDAKRIHPKCYVLVMFPAGEVDLVNHLVDMR